MTRRLDNALGRWLHAERGGENKAAEAALAQVFARVPMPVPSAGFADRVLVAAGLERPATGFSRPARAAVAAVLLAAGLTLALLVPVALGVLRWVPPSDLVAGAIRGLVALVQRLDEAVSLWRVVAFAVETLSHVVTAPPFHLTVLVLTLLSALAFRTLNQLLSPSRNPAYAEIH